MKGWLGVTVAALIACGEHRSSDGDAAGGAIDAAFSGACSPAAAQCNNCRDDDADGKIDGFDPECTGPLDNDEASFKTGIPGDNIDPVMQDCFFDGNSGAGNDGCNVHVCCLLGITTTSACPFGASRFDVGNCPPPLGNTPLPQTCIDTCTKLAPAGCDCFGCCTICTTDGTCRDVDINPATSPSCTQTNIVDPGADGQLGTSDDPCRGCVQIPTCGNPDCGGASCVLCPGQDPASLPTACGGTSSCPDGQVACATDGSCPPSSYCANGCCIATIL